MEQVKKKSSSGLKLATVLFAVIDVLLLAALVLVFVTGRASHETGSSTLSTEFQPNDETYYSNNAESYQLSETVTVGRNNVVAATQTPTEMPASEQSGAVNADGFLFPDSNQQELTDAQLQEKVTDREKCRQAINEIYARHGYQFSTESIYNYFMQYSWYQALPKNSDMTKVDDTFNAVEKKNIEKLQAFKSAHGWD